MDINLENIFVVFDHNQPSEIVSLKGLDLKINSGDRITLIGNNNNGKSTLLQLIAGHIEPTFGKIMINGQDITYQSLAEKSEIFSLLSCNHADNCHDDLLVIENLTLALMSRRDISPIKTAVDEKRISIISEYLNKYDFLNIQDVLYTYTSCITQAQKYALSLMMIALRHPKVILVDDFMSNLDKEIGTRLIKTIENITNDQKLTLIAVMSNPKMEFEFFNRCIILGNGRVTLDLTGEAKTKLDFSKIFDHFDVVPNIKDIKQDTASLI